jgi:hypothetical protein
MMGWIEILHVAYVNQGEAKAVGICVGKSSKENATWEI